MGNNIGKEYTLSLFFLKHPKVISKIAGIEVKGLALEKYYHGRKVDCYGKVCNREIFIENQLTSADDTHLAQVKEIMENLEGDGTIIWIAKSFSSKYIELLEKIIKGYMKNVEVILVEMNEGVLDALDIIAEVHEFEVIKNFNLLEDIIENNLSIVFRYFRKDGSIQEVNNKDMEKLGEKQILVEKLIEELRKRMYYFPSVYRERKTEGNRIVIGAGITSANYIIGINRYDEITVELTFNNSGKEIFEKILEQKDAIDEKFEYLLDWDIENMRLFSYAKYKDDDGTHEIKRQIIIFEKLVLFFTEFRDKLENESIKDELERG